MQDSVFGERKKSKWIESRTTVLKYSVVGLGLTGDQLTLTNLPELSTVTLQVHTLHII